MAEANAAWRIIERAPRPTGGGVGLAGLGVLGDSGDPGLSGVGIVMCGSVGVKLRITSLVSSIAFHATSVPAPMMATITSTPIHRPVDEPPPPPPKRLGRPESLRPA